MNRGSNYIILDGKCSLHLELYYLKRCKFKMVTVVGNAMFTVEIYLFIERILHCALLHHYCSTGFSGNTRGPQMEMILGLIFIYSILHNRRTRISLFR